MNTMNDVIQFVTAFIAGVLLGSVYFVGLWWTVRKLPQVRHPLFTYFGSLAVRLLVVLGGFYLLLTFYHWQALAVSLLGFIGVRVLLVRFIARSTASNQTVQ